MSRRIAITGIGLVTALGTTREETWRRMVAGNCGVGPATVFDASGFRSRVAAEVDMGPIDAGMTPLQRRRRSRGDRIAVHAASEAVCDAGLLDARTAIERIHRPDFIEQVEQARATLRMHEAFVLQVALLQQRAFVRALSATSRAPGALLERFDADGLTRRVGDELKMNWGHKPGDMAAIKATYEKIKAAM